MRRLFGFLTVFSALFALSGAAAAVNDAVLMAKRPAKLLSDYGLFADGAAQVPGERVVAYELISPLFTDYAHKFRFIYVPEGKTAAYDDTEVLDFPVGSALVKTFAYPADFRKPEENIRLLETRLLIHQAEGWVTWAYVWNEDQSDAVLKVAGATIPVSWTDESGATRGIQYVVPNKNQCKGCHVLDKAVSPIGPKARNLNRDNVYSGSSQNQLAHLSAIGFLTGAPSPDQAPRVPAPDDVTASLDARARAYLDVNCAHCHREEGPASTSGLFLTYGETRMNQVGVKKRPVAAGRGSGDLAYDIDPGHADRSIIPFRMESVDPGVMMPELGRTVAHAEGVKLISDWINSMKE